MSMKHDLVAINDGGQWLTTIADIDTHTIANPKQWVATQSVSKLPDLDEVMDMAARLDAPNIKLWDDGWTIWTEVEQ